MKLFIHYSIALAAKYRDFDGFGQHVCVAVGYRSIRAACCSIKQDCEDGGIGTLDSSRAYDGLLSTFVGFKHDP